MVGRPALDVELAYPTFELGPRLADYLSSCDTVRQAFYKLATYLVRKDDEEAANKTRAIGDILSGHDQDLMFDVSHAGKFVTGPLTVMKQLLHGGLAGTMYWHEAEDQIEDQDTTRELAFGEWAKDHRVEIEGVELPCGSVVTVSGVCVGIVPYIGDLYEGQVALGIETSEGDRYEILLDTTYGNPKHFWIGLSRIDYKLEAVRKVRTHDCAEADSERRLSEEDIMFMAAGTIAQRNLKVRKLLSVTLSRIAEHVAQSVLQQYLVIVPDDEGNVITNVLCEGKHLIVLPRTMWQLPPCEQMQLLLTRVVESPTVGIAWDAEHTADQWLNIGINSGESQSGK